MSFIAWQEQTLACFELTVCLVYLYSAFRLQTFIVPWLIAFSFAVIVTHKQFAMFSLLKIQEEYNFFVVKYGLVILMLCVLDC